MVSFGEYIRDLRKKKGLTQRELAKKVEIDFTYLSKIENGIRDDSGKPMLPSKEKIGRLAKELGEDADEMLLLAEKTTQTVENWMKSKTFQEFYRAARSHGLTEEDWKQLADIVKKRKKK